MHYFQRLTLSVILATAASHGLADTSLTKRSLAAGYKAAFTCSATFNAGRSEAEIEAGELSGIYPDYREAMAGLGGASIDEDGRTVAVTYDDSAPPRYAAWRGNSGCVQIPMGSDPKSFDLPPEVRFKRVDQSQTPWPMGDKVGNANGSAALRTIVDDAFTGERYGAGTNTTAVLVTSPQALIYEAYREDFGPFIPQRTWSVAKSIAASVVGTAVLRDMLAVDRPVPIPQWQTPGDPRQQITWTHLLHMASGLESGSTGSRTDATYFGGQPVAETAPTHALEAVPGQRWKYANNDTLLLMLGLRSLFDDTDRYGQFPFRALLHPIGMYHTYPERDWQGTFVMSSQVWTTARDLGRLGILYLEDGVWGNQRILPEGWSQFVRTPAPSQPPERNSRGQPSPGYGAQFWLLGERHSKLPVDTFAAMGHRGQYVVVIPSRNLVIVRRGLDESGGTRFDIGSFTLDILRALGS
ncbi:serine hydrolase domain-containing protein [Biformimicrobium ophioploci]|uniref:Serine hydrolase n=1 Tax=Biformimicrobium ophioploci TaxID=3036711 RepID=A0ABQ6LV47_9GAMM|nr:serine hydrolase [Microbulbifer sp. NKW57]GMG85960.1 serine hydrolase [Microbulbifer sp. NKW57]